MVGNKKVHSYFNVIQSVLEEVTFFSSKIHNDYQLGTLYRICMEQKYTHTVS